MNKSKPVMIESVPTVAKGTKELQKIVATEVLYNENEECLEELFENGEEIGRTRNTGDNNQSS
jgi:hypothetical protein